MKIDVQPGAIQEVASELIVVNLFQGVTTPGGATGAVDRALGGMIGELIAAGDFKGKAEETAVLYPRGAIEALSQAVREGIGGALPPWGDPRQARSPAGVGPS